MADGLLTSIMRIATWNVNSLKARLEKVFAWLERARPDVLLIQETKLADSAAPVAEFPSMLTTWNRNAKSCPNR